MTNQELMDIVKYVKINHNQRNGLITLGIFSAGCLVVIYFYNKNYSQQKLVNQSLSTQNTVLQDQVNKLAQSDKEKNTIINRLNNRILNI